MKTQSLTRFAWLSIGAAVLTISLKALAYIFTGSVGLLSDAIESLVNLAAAIVALIVLKIAEKPPDEHHLYGHTKVEYFSSVLEGVFIIIASISIVVTAVERVLEPKPVEQAFLGLAISAGASFINLIVGRILLKAGKKYRSITLEADGHHLMTDVWTSFGVVIGVALVSITGIGVIDPIIAIVVALNILFTGFKLIKESAFGLMDTVLPAKEMKEITRILDSYSNQRVSYHGLLSRQSGTRRFLSVHILVPGDWTIQKGHDLLEEIEQKICDTFPMITVFTHLEPEEDPKSHEDISIDRKFKK